MLYGIVYVVGRSPYTSKGEDILEAYCLGTALPAGCIYRNVITLLYTCECIFFRHRRKPANTRQCKRLRFVVARIEAKVSSRTKRVLFLSNIITSSIVYYIHVIASRIAGRIIVSLSLSLAGADCVTRVSSPTPRGRGGRRFMRPAEN